jgi:xylulokinase
MCSLPPLFIGLDNSTQALKAVVVDVDLQTVYEYRLDFSQDLPHYKTKSGVIIAEDGSVVAPVLMYVEALEAVFDNLKQK